MHTIIRKQLGMHSYQLQKNELLSDDSKDKRRVRVQVFLKKLNSGTLPYLIFSDKCKFDL